MWRCCGWSNNGHEVDRAACACPSFRFHSSQSTVRRIPCTRSPFRLRLAPLPADLFSEIPEGSKVPGQQECVSQVEFRATAGLANELRAGRQLQPGSRVVTSSTFSLLLEFPF